MIKTAYAHGTIAALAKFGLANQPKPIFNTMVQTPTTNEMPNFGQALRQRTNHFGDMLGIR